MEVASRIVVMNHARVEQVGSPTEIYDAPASDFVMGFVGRVNRLQNAFIRPHEVRLCDPGEPGCERAAVERVLAFGPETRVDLRLERDGERLWAHLPAGAAALPRLEEGDIVGVDLSRARPVATA